MHFRLIINTTKQRRTRHEDCHIFFVAKLNKNDFYRPGSSKKWKTFLMINTIFYRCDHLMLANRVELSQSLCLWRRYILVGEAACTKYEFQPQCHVSPHHTFNCFKYLAQSEESLYLLALSQYKSGAKPLRAYHLLKERQLKLPKSKYLLGKCCLELNK